VGLVLWKWESVMAEKKKAYQRFGELIRQETAPTPAEAEPDRVDAIEIRLSPEVRRALEQHAAAEGATPSDIVQEALRRYLQGLR
jgi:ribbon-helix-helix CopG family protein